MKNAFDRLINRMDMVEEKSVNLKICLKEILKLKWKQKK